MIVADTLLKRLLTFPFIQPITNETWHTPLMSVKGFNPLYLSAENTHLPPETWVEIDHYADEHNSRALLIMYKNQLVFEKYYRGFNSKHRFNSMSMMKTVLSLLIGIAVDEGVIESIDMPAAHFLNEWQNDERQYITLRHLLTMQSGLFSDIALSRYFRHIIPLYLGDNIERFALSFPLVESPGQQLEYNNVNSQLLGIILQRATGIHYAQYLSEKLWQPLCCTDANIWVDNKQCPRTFAALFANPQEWMKIAQLLLNNGRYQNQQIVSSSWIEQMKQGADSDKRYGLHLWTKAHVFDQCAGIPAKEYYPSEQPFDYSDTFFLEGLRMQCLTVVPEKELIVFRMGERPKRDWDNAKFVNQIACLF